MSDPMAEDHLQDKITSRDPFCTVPITMEQTFRLGVQQIMKRFYVHPMLGYAPARTLMLWLYPELWASIIDEGTASALEFLRCSDEASRQSDSPLNGIGYTVDEEALQSVMSWLRDDAGAWPARPDCNEWMNIRSLEASTRCQLSLGASIAKEMNAGLVVVDDVMLNALEEGVLLAIDTNRTSLCDHQTGARRSCTEGSTREMALSASTSGLYQKESSMHSDLSSQGSTSPRAFSMCSPHAPSSPLFSRPGQDVAEPRILGAPGPSTLSQCWHPEIQHRPKSHKKSFQAFAAQAVWEHCNKMRDRMPVVLHILNANNLQLSHPTFLAELKKLTRRNSKLQEKPKTSTSLIQCPPAQVLVVASSSTSANNPQVDDGFPKILLSNLFESLLENASRLWPRPLLILLDTAHLAWNAGQSLFCAILNIAIAKLWALFPFLRFLVNHEAMLPSELFTAMVDLHPRPQAVGSGGELHKAAEEGGCAHKGVQVDGSPLSQWLFEQDHAKEIELGYTTWRCMRFLQEAAENGAHAASLLPLPWRWYPASDKAAAVLSWAVGFLLAQGARLEGSDAFPSEVNHMAIRFGVHMTLTAKLRPRVLLPVSQRCRPDVQHMQAVAEALQEEVLQLQAAAQGLLSARSCSGDSEDGPAAATTEPAAQSSCHGHRLRFQGGLMDTSSEEGHSGESDGDADLPPQEAVQVVLASEVEALQRQLEEQCKALQDAFAEKEQELGALQRKAGSLEGELRLLEEKHRLVEEEKSAVGARWEEEHQKSQEAQQKLAHLQEQLQQRETALAAVEKEWSHADEEVSKKAAEVARLSEELNHVGEQAGAARRQLEEEQKIHAVQAHDWQLRERELQGEGEKLRLTVQELRTELNNNRAERHAEETRRLWQEKTRLAAEVASLLQELQSARDEASRLQQENARIRKAQRNEGQELASVRAKIETLIAEKRGLEERIGQQDIDLGKLREANLALQEGLKQLPKEEQFATQLALMSWCSQRMDLLGLFQSEQQALLRSLGLPSMVIPPTSTGSASPSFGMSDETLSRWTPPIRSESVPQPALSNLFSLSSLNSNATAGSPTISRTTSRINSSRGVGLTTRDRNITQGIRKEGATLSLASGNALGPVPPSRVKVPTGLAGSSLQRSASHFPVQQ